jgi:archaellum component FlaG (FlaF/FlaG flagellin family)
MSTALGLILFVVFLVAVPAVAAGITWVVVKLSPSRNDAATPKSPA